ncbi:hypothetical protein WMY93_002273 [Mugilogobius chulae]|uniref:Uncharacterized protein n=1 Tax=Mugilogobius chulae TaxID=88201 RepID=A0AAW0Q370_9GOBI
MTKESDVKVEATVERVQIKTEAEKVQIRPKVQPKQQISDVRAEKEAYTEAKEAVKSEEIIKTVTEKPKKLEQTPVNSRREKKAPEKTSESVVKVPEASAEKKRRPEGKRLTAAAILCLTRKKRTVKKSKLEKTEDKTSDVVTDLTTKTMDFVEEEAATVEEKIVVSDGEERELQSTF